MAFDGIVTKAVANEIQELKGARIDKILQPNKNSIVIGFYLDGKNYALNTCIESQNYRFHLTTHPKPNPQVAPNFCMILRKHLLGLRIKNVITSDLERVITIEFEGFDDIDDIICKKLIIELMGKHSNIILLEEESIIIDSLRHIPSNENRKRSIVPHEKYIKPENSKYSFLDSFDFEDFKFKLKAKESDLDINNISNIISNCFNGICKSFVQAIIDELELKDLNDDVIHKIYDYIKNIVDYIDSGNLVFKNIYDGSGNLKDYYLSHEENDRNFNLNFFIDDFYYNKETSEEFKTYRNTLLRLILDTLKKYNKRLVNINQKLEECENMDTYRLYGELITSNLYRIKDINSDSIEIENYYDNNNFITIPLDKKYVPSINAKRYFKKYNKLKNTLEIVSIQKKETIEELNYIESIVYELESCSSLEEVSEIFEEISENDIFENKKLKYKKKQNSKLKKSKLTKNKAVSFNPIKYTIDGYTILVGKNNKENDYLSLKYANKTDLWFHTKDIHGSHVVLKLDDNKLPQIDIIIKCAEIAAFYSKARTSSNVSVDYCLVKYVKKPHGSKPGMVIYTDYQTLNVNPKIK